jgi:hypothetical protein
LINCASSGHCFLGRQPIRLVDQIGQAALQPKRLGLALPHRCSLLGVAVAQRPQAAGLNTKRWASASGS